MKKVLTIIILIIGAIAGGVQLYSRIQHDAWMSTTIEAVNGLQLPDNLDSD